MTELAIAPSRRLDAIQFLRFAAAFMVVVFHADLFTNNIHPRGADDPLVMFSRIGLAGVPAFFVISGFIMMHTSGRSFARPGATVGFLVRRITRIYPIFWVTMGIFALLAFAGRQDTTDFSPGNFVWASLLVPGYADLFISPAWTLAYEMYFYIVFGLALFLPRRVGLAGLFTLFLGAIALGRVTDLRQTNAFLQMAMDPALSEFLAGVALGWIVAQRQLAPLVLRRWLGRLCLAGALTGFVLIGFLFDADVPNVVMLGVPGALIVGWAVIAERCGHLPGWVQRLAWLGDSSYAIYLIHILAMSLAMPLARGLFDAFGAGPLVLVVLLTTLSVLAGILLHMFVEVPMLRLLRQTIARLRPLTA